MKLKIFVGAPCEVEKEANTWLRENGGIEVLQMTQSESANSLTLTIIYAAETHKTAGF